MDEPIQEQPPIQVDQSSQPIQQQRQLPWKWISVGLLLLLIIVGTLLYFFDWVRGPIDYGDDGLGSPSRQVSPTSTIQNAHLNTYSSAKYAFSLQYTNGFSIKENISKYDDTFGVNIYDYLLPPTEADVQESYNTNISITVGDKNLKRSDFYYGGYEWTKSIIELLANETIGVQKDHKFDSISKIDSVSLSGFNGVKFTATTKAGTDTEGTPGESRIAIALMNGDKTYYIEGTKVLMSNAGVSPSGDSLIVVDEVTSKEILVFKPNN